MKQLFGEYECKIDAKGRMRLPSDLLSQLDQEGEMTFIINRGSGKYLRLFPEKVWEVESEKVNQLNPYDKDNMKFIRLFNRGASKITTDSSNRILVKKNLLEWAGIEKEAILSTMFNYIEIWSKDNWEMELTNEPEDFSDLAQKVLGDKKESE
ncbi:MAG: division/cell wall cluster transcriptional repressor MraZ [Bacteroidota bacterium]